MILETRSAERQQGTGRIGGRGLGLFCLVATFAVSMPAQDSLQLSLQNDNAARTRQAHVAENAPYTVRWGDLQALAGFSLGGGWIDNVNLSNADPLDDFFIRPLANVNLYWPVTEINALTFSLGVGYEAYFRYHQYDQLLVEPGSRLGWDIVIKDVKINVHDFVTYDQNPTSSGAVSGLGRFGTLDNTAGVVADWDLHDVVLSLGYDHENVFYSPSTYEYLNHASDFGYFRASLGVHPAVRVGVEASGGPTSYPQRPERNNQTYSAGAFVAWTATAHIRLQARGGYYDYTFYNQQPPLGIPDQNGYYLAVQADHDVRRNLGYTLGFGREAYFGVYSSLTEEWYGRVFVRWQILEHLTATTGFRYEWATQPIVAGFSDEYDRISVTAGLSFPLREKLTGSLDYQYWLKNDDVTSSLDYRQNRVMLQLTYRF